MPRQTLSTASRPWPHCGMITCGSTHAQSASFPRPQGRGPIAAATGAGTLLLATLPFHGLKAVAPLRQFTSVGDHGRTRLSTASRPWPHCGPVDGTYAPPRRPPFHGLKAVAPLRQVHWWLSRARTWAPFHGLKAVAPLRRPDVYPAKLPPSLSTASRPWPHCGGSLLCSASTASTLSTASRPWPHCGLTPLGGYKQVTFLSTASRPWPHCGSLPHGE